MGLTDMYVIFHPTETNMLSFLHMLSSLHGNFSKLGHILGHKARLTNYKGTEKKSLKKLEKKCKNPKNQMKMKA